MANTTISSIIPKWNIANWQILSMILILTLSGIGLSFVTGYHISIKLTGDPFFFVNKHIKLVMLGLLVGGIFYLIPTNKLLKYSPLIFSLSLLFLMLVFIPGLGKKISGANRWISLGPLSFQPSEIMKVSFILYYAYFLNIKIKKIDGFKFGLFPSFVILFLPVVLIAIEPDFSTSIIFLSIGFLMMFAAGLPIVYFAFSIVISLPFFIYFIQTKKYFLSRFLFFSPELDPYGRGYHILQSLSSFKNSGIFGMKANRIIDSIRLFPDTHTDFTYSVVARVGGVAGAVMILAVYLFLFFFCLKLANQIKSYTEKLIVVGVVSLFAMEFFFHLLVTTGLIPTTGILMPFFSYGGTAFMTHFALVGILLRISTDHFVRENHISTSTNGVRPYSLKTSKKN